MLMLIKIQCQVRYRLGYIRLEPFTNESKTEWNLSKTQPTPGLLSAFAYINLKKPQKKSRICPVPWILSSWCKKTVSGSRLPSSSELQKSDPHTSAKFWRVTRMIENSLFYSSGKFGDSSFIVSRRLSSIHSTKIEHSVSSINSTKIEILKSLWLLGGEVFSNQSRKRRLFRFFR